jgi:hypothetical protein
MVVVIIGLVSLAVVLAGAAFVASRSKGGVSWFDSSGGAARFFESMRGHGHGGGGGGGNPGSFSSAASRASSHDQRRKETLGGVPAPMRGDARAALEAMGTRGSNGPRRNLKDAGGLGITNKRF